MNKFRVTTLNGGSNLLVSRFEFEGLSYAIKVAEETPENLRAIVSVFNPYKGGWVDILDRRAAHTPPEGYGLRTRPPVLLPIF